MEIAWRRWLINHVTITLGVIVLVILGWNVYVAANDDGVLSGRVVGPDGAPVEGAKVTLLERSVTTLVVQDETRTDAEGRFRFDGHGQYAAVLTAEKPGLGSTPRRQVRLYFRNQNRELKEPLRIAPGPG